MPQVAASLRLDGRSGLPSLRRRRLIYTIAAALAVLPLWTAPATGAEQPRDPSRLWSEFPVNTPPREPTAARPKAGQRARAGRLAPAAEPAALSADPASIGLWLLLVPAGALALVTVAVFLRARARRRPLPKPQRGVSAGAEHLLFVPTDESYVLVEAKGEPPDVGTWLNRNLSREHVFLVQKVGPSPLPDDSRRCAYLERW